MNLIKENGEIVLIDFTNAENQDIDYGGSSLKKAIKYNNENYILKLQEKDFTHYKFKKGTEHFSDMTYFNSVFSEYIASQIANNIGLDVHSTLLGFSLEEGEKYNVVACKNFLKENEELFTFRYIYKKNELKIRKLYPDFNIETLDGTLKAIELQDFFDPEILKEFFWDMFIFDGYIGNFDRNPSNWGIVLNKKNGIKKIAPIFDNASCLHPKTPRVLIDKYLNDLSVIEDKAIFMPSMTYKEFIPKKEKTKRIKYHDFFKFYKKEDFLKAVMKIAPKIIKSHDKNKEIINSLSGVIEDSRKLLLLQEMDLRLENLIIPTYDEAKKYFEGKVFVDNKIEDKLKKLQDKYKHK